MKDKVDIWFLIIGNLVLGVIPWLVSFIIPFEWGLVFYLFIFLIVSPIFFLVSSYLVGKKNKNVWFVLILSTIVLIFLRIITKELCWSYIFIYILLGYIGYFTGRFINR